MSAPIGIWQSAIGNVTTRPLPCGGTDLMSLIRSYDARRLYSYTAARGNASAASPAHLPSHHSAGRATAGQTLYDCRRAPARLHVSHPAGFARLYLDCHGRWALALRRL